MINDPFKDLAQHLNEEQKDTLVDILMRETGTQYITSAQNVFLSANAHFDWSAKKCVYAATEYATAVLISLLNAVRETYPDEHKNLLEAAIKTIKESEDINKQDES